MAATFYVLETFQMLSFMSKVSAFKFYQALARRTDNTSTSVPPVRMSPLSHLNMVIWTFISAGPLSWVSVDGS